MFQMLGVADGIKLGRRRLEDSDAVKVAAIVAARAKGTGIRRIARELGVKPHCRSARSLPTETPPDSRRKLMVPAAIRLCFDTRPSSPVVAGRA